MSRIVAVGEAMLELCSAGDSNWSLGIGGDTLNTAVHCARLGANVTYLSALGSDPFSNEMIRRFQAEGIDTSLVLRSGDRLPGLYAIKTDPMGERSFYYWRQQSAVRNLFTLAGIDLALDRAARTDLLYLSGITLSLFDVPGQFRLLELVKAVRANGGRVAFDPNFRPAGWSDPMMAKTVFDAFSPAVNIALPTFEDEQLLHGDATPVETIERWRGQGATDIVVKVGESGCLIDEEGSIIPVLPDARIKPIDTTGAGDSFNAAYLVARFSGVGRSEAARHGNTLAGKVIQHTGAIGHPPPVA